jgi:hypothetical protein
LFRNFIRVIVDYQTLTETFPELWPELKDGESIDTITEDLIIKRIAIKFI